MAASYGFEPQSTGSEPVVLPLNDEASGLVGWIRTSVFLFRRQAHSSALPRRERLLVVGPGGVEPPLRASEAHALIRWRADELVETARVELATTGCRPVMIPLSLRPHKGAPKGFAPSTYAAFPPRSNHYVRGKTTLDDAVGVEPTCKVLQTLVEPPDSTPWYLRGRRAATPRSRP